LKDHCISFYYRPTITTTTTTTTTTPITAAAAAIYLVKIGRPCDGCQDAEVRAFKIFEDSDRIYFR